jgi:hypothetical protein
MNGNCPKWLVITTEKTRFYSVNAFIQTELLYQIVMEGLGFFIKRESENSNWHHKKIKCPAFAQSEGYQPGMVKNIRPCVVNKVPDALLDRSSHTHFSLKN